MSPDQFAHLFNVSRETMDSFIIFREELERWNAKINLVAPSTMPEAWERHFADSAQLTRYTQAGLKWTDLGSGAGFPSIVLSILLGHHPRFHMTAIESDTRKAAFLTHISAKLALPMTIVAQRIEDVEPTQAEVVSARALAPLEKLLHYAEPHLKIGGKCLFLKGKTALSELTTARRSWIIDARCHQSITDPQASVVEIGAARRAQ